MEEKRLSPQSPTWNEALTIIQPWIHPNLESHLFLVPDAFANCASQGGKGQMTLLEDWMPEILMSLSERIATVWCSLSAVLNIVKVQPKPFTKTRIRITNTTPVQPLTQVTHGTVLILIDTTGPSWFSSESTSSFTVIKLDSTNEHLVDFLVCFAF